MIPRTGMFILLFAVLISPSMAQTQVTKPVPAKNESHGELVGTA